MLRRDSCAATAEEHGDCAEDRRAACGARCGSRCGVSVGGSAPGGCAAEPSCGKGGVIRHERAGAFVRRLCGNFRRGGRHHVHCKDHCLCDREAGGKRHFGECERIYFHPDGAYPCGARAVHMAGELHACRRRGALCFAHCLFQRRDDVDLLAVVPAYA